MMINENESIEYVLCATIVAPGPNIIPLRPQKKTWNLFPFDWFVEGNQNTT